jgi:hypothetical protein
LKDVSALKATLRLASGIKPRNLSFFDELTGLIAALVQRARNLDAFAGMSLPPLRRFI